jgi:hypothetical protein
MLPLLPCFAPDPTSAHGCHVCAPPPLFICPCPGAQHPVPWHCPSSVPPPAPAADRLKTRSKGWRRRRPPAAHPSFRQRFPGTGRTGVTPSRAAAHL